MRNSRWRKIEQVRLCASFRDARASHSNDKLIGWRKSEAPRWIIARVISPPPLPLPIIPWLNDSSQSRGWSTRSSGFVRLSRETCAEFQRFNRCFFSFSFAFPFETLRFIDNSSWERTGLWKRGDYFIVVWVKDTF